VEADRRFPNATATRTATRRAGSCRRARRV